MSFKSSLGRSNVPIQPPTICTSEPIPNAERNAASLPELAASVGSKSTTTMLARGASVVLIGNVKPNPSIRHGCAPTPAKMFDSGTVCDVTFVNSTNCRSLLFPGGLYITSLMTTGPISGPLLVAPSVTDFIGYKSPVALGQRPNETLSAAATRLTWFSKSSRLPFESAESSQTSSSCEPDRPNGTLPPLGTAGLNAVSSITRYCPAPIVVPVGMRYFL